MDWDGLRLNLASEAIGILVTVFGVDLLLRRHEQRAWRSVREVFLKQADVVVDKLWTFSEEWLGAMAQDWPAHAGWAHVSHEAAHRENCEGVIRDFEALYEMSSVQAPRSRAAAISDLAPGLQQRLAAGFFPRPLQAHLAWASFRGRAFPLLESFDRLLSSYASLVDPELALIGIQLHRDRDLLGTLEASWEQDITAYEATKGRPVVGTALQQGPSRSDLEHGEFVISSAVASFLVDLALLSLYIRRNRRTRTTAWFPDSVDPIAERRRLSRIKALAEAVREFGGRGGPAGRP